MSASPRLDKLLANLGYGTRSEVQSLIYRERVLLDGTPLDDPKQHLPLSPDLPARMKVDGAPLDPLPGMVLMLHKPLGVTCSHKDSGPLVYGLLPERWRRRDPGISTVGRLDKETSGLLLLTDDGQLLHRIIAPRHAVSKRYHVTLDRPLRGDEVTIFAAGTLMLESEKDPLLPALLEPLSATEAYLTITEGRYHQVRRMFAAMGNHVTALHRDRIGALALPETLEAGAWQLLEPDAIASIFTH